MTKVVKKKKDKPKVKVLKRIGRPTSFSGVWADLVRAAGSVEHLSQEMGKSVRQIRRIAHRESPLTGSTLIAARAVAEKHGMLGAFEEWRGAEARE